MFNCFRPIPKDEILLPSICAKRYPTDEMNIIDFLASNWTRNPSELVDVRAELFHLRHVIEERCLKTMKNKSVLVDCNLVLPRTDHCATQTENEEIAQPSIKTEFEEASSLHELTLHKLGEEATGASQNDLKNSNESKIEVLDLSEEVLSEKRQFQTNMGTFNSANFVQDECKISAETAVFEEGLNVVCDNRQTASSKTREIFWSESESSFVEKSTQSTDSEMLEIDTDSKLAVGDVKTGVIQMEVSLNEDNLNQNVTVLDISNTEINTNQGSPSEVPDSNSTKSTDSDVAILECSPREQSNLCQSRFVIDSDSHVISNLVDDVEKQTKDSSSNPFLSVLESAIKDSSSISFADRLDFISAPKRVSSINIQDSVADACSSYGGKGPPANVVDGAGKDMDPNSDTGPSADEVNITCLESREQLHSSSDEEDEIIEVSLPNSSHNSSAVSANAVAKCTESLSKVNQSSEGSFVSSAAKVDAWSLDPVKSMKAVFEVFREGVMTSYSFEIGRYVRRARDDARNADQSYLFVVLLQPGQYTYCVHVSSCSTESLFKIPIPGDKSCNAVMNMQNVKSGHGLFPELYIVESVTQRITTLPLRSCPDDDDDSKSSSSNGDITACSHLGSVENASEEGHVSSSPVAANPDQPRCSIPKIISVSSVSSSATGQPVTRSFVNVVEMDYNDACKSESPNVQVDSHGFISKTRKRVQSERRPGQKTFRRSKAAAAAKTTPKCNSNAKKSRSMGVKSKDRAGKKVESGSRNKGCLIQRRSPSPVQEYTPEDLNKTNSFALTSLVSEDENRYSVSVGQHVKMGCRYRLPSVQFNMMTALNKVDRFRPIRMYMYFVIFPMFLLFLR